MTFFSDDCAISLMGADFEDSFHYLFMACARLLRFRMDTALREATLDLTPGDAHALITLDRLGSVRQVDLAAALGIEPMSVIWYLNRLEKRGLIERRRATSDKRSKLICSTERARTELIHVRRILDEVCEDGMSNFSIDESSTFLSLLQRLHDDMAAGGQAAGIPTG